ncbi:MAG: hypothetical protein K0Q55_3771, partial [Verrucomicrobia bacterium]|nr:hypothetical protein [Verrucomicrobiota bacterium]
MRIGNGLEIFANPGVSFRRIHSFQALGNRFRTAAKRQGLCALQQRFDRPAKLRPILHLSGDGAFDSCTSHPGIQHQFIREFHWLTHNAKVAFCYLVVNLGKITCQPFVSTPSCYIPHLCKTSPS